MTPQRCGMHNLGFRESVLQPGFFIHQQKEVHVVTHVKWFKQGAVGELRHQWPVHRRLR